MLDFNGYPIAGSEWRSRFNKNGKTVKIIAVKGQLSVPIVLFIKTNGKGTQSLYLETFLENYEEVGPTLRFKIKNDNNE